MILFIILFLFDLLEIISEKILESFSLPLEEIIFSFNEDVENVGVNGTPINNVKRYDYSEIILKPQYQYIALLFHEL